MSNLPNLKGGDTLSISEAAFHGVYRRYVAIHNTAVEYMKQERVLIGQGGDPEEVAAARNMTSLAWKKAKALREEVRTEWAALKKIYRIFNRDHRL